MALAPRVSSSKERSSGIPTTDFQPYYICLWGCLYLRFCEDCHSSLMLFGTVTSSKLFKSFFLTMSRPPERAYHFPFWEVHFIIGVTTKPIDRFLNFYFHSSSFFVRGDCDINWPSSSAIDPTFQLVCPKSRLLWCVDPEFFWWRDAGAFTRVWFLRGISHISRFVPWLCGRLSSDLAG